MYVTIVIHFFYINKSEIGFKHVALRPALTALQVAFVRLKARLLARERFQALLNYFNH